MKTTLEMNRGVLAGRRGHSSSNFFEIVGCSGISIVRRKILVLLLLVTRKVVNFIGKLLNLAPLRYRCHDTPRDDVMDLT